MKKQRLFKFALASLLTALVFVGTELHIPTAIGHVNLGDAAILISAYILGPYALIPAALGSTLADLLAGYPQYAIATFIIKGLMGLVSGLLLKSNNEGKTSLVRKVIASFTAELIMIAGYFLFESLPFMYGTAAALGSVIPNGVQAIAAVVIATPIMNVRLLEKYRTSHAGTKKYS
ncbi:MAG: ECF transporter S component [Saccharofermentans sp.]|nr:ECF transporter S component [Saccharofermentans sp.]